MSHHISRRRFLATSAVGLGALVIPARCVRSYTANEKIRVALVGVGGRGEWFVDTIPRMEQVVAVCDVDRRKADAAYRHWEQAALRYAASPHEWERNAAVEFEKLAKNRPECFADFRAMLDKLDNRVDAVVAATPDHTHAVAAAAAMRAGKAIFCEKPLTRTIHESRALRQLARETRVVTAMGNQGTYSGAFRRAVELIRNGTIGDIQEVHVWNDGGGADMKSPPQGTENLPAELSWDLWLGPAAARPFHTQWMNRHLWREFGTCQLGNWGSHSANVGFMALRVHDLWLAADPASPATIRVEAQQSGVNRLSFPRWEHVQWHVPARAALPPITINWYNGAAPAVSAVLERAFQETTRQQREGWQFAGTFIVGTKGSIHTTGHNMWFRLLPGAQFEGVQCDRPETLPESRGPEQDWFAAIRGGDVPWSNFDYASSLNEFLMLGNVATQFDGPLEYDPVGMKIVGNAEADALLSSEYRAGWQL